MIPYRRSVERFVKKLLGSLRPNSIILYGSMARETHGAGSDVDLLIISSKLSKDFLERLKLLYLLNPSYAPIEPIGYTPDEFESMLKKGHPTALHALEEGLVIYDDGYWIRMKQYFENLKRKGFIIRTEDGWEVRLKGV